MGSINFTHDFFENEVREDFFVPSMIKRTWAAQLTVLDDVGCAVRKHGMEYCAQWGTLLGAIRHRGFIPWDDDVDISMKRVDYNRFVENAAQLLPEGYSIVNYKSSVDFRQMLCRVVNSDHYRFDDDFMSKYSGLPFAVGLDIFPLDFLTDDEEYEKNRHDRVYLVQSVLDNIEYKDGKLLDFEKCAGRKITNPTVLSGLKMIEQICNVHIDKNADINAVRRRLRELLEEIYGEVSEKDAKYITLYPIWFSNPDYKFPKEYYARFVDISFENISLPVPICYEQVLLKNYGASFMTPIRSGGAHNYPCYKNHLDVLREHFGYEWPRYEIEWDEVLNCSRENGEVSEKRKTAVNGSKEYEIEFNKVVEQYIAILRCNQESFESCQGFAIELGELIEKRFGEGTKSVGVLEKLCEALYEASLCEGAYCEPDIRKILNEFESTYEEELSHRKLILVISYSKKAFGMMLPIVEEYSRCPNNVIKILPILRIEIAPSMKSQQIVDEYENYMKMYAGDSDFGAAGFGVNGFNAAGFGVKKCLDNVEVVREFDFAAKPDVIITNYGYDEYDLITSVSSEYYIRNLKKVCAHLVYVSPFDIKDVRDDDERLLINLSEIVRMPGFALSDEVIVASQQLKEAVADIFANQYRAECGNCMPDGNNVTGKNGALSEKNVFEGNDILSAEIRNKICEKISVIGHQAVDVNDSPNAIDIKDAKGNCSSDDSKCRTLLYYIGISELADNKEKALNKIKHNLEIFNNEKDKLKVEIVIEEGLETALSESVVKELFDTLEGWNIRTESPSPCPVRTESPSPCPKSTRLDECCAYYGAPSHLATAFMLQGKPVMIRNVEV